MGVNTPGLAGANLEQDAEHFGIGPWRTRLAVRAELNEAEGLRHSGPMANVTPRQLLRLYGRIENARSASERYAILAEPIPARAQPADESLVWFDIIHGLTAPHIIHSIGRVAYKLATTSGKRWPDALDLGTGTGNLSAILLGRREVPRSVGHLTTIDREKSLLAIAARRYPEADHVLGDVLRLRFPDASFDVATSGGVAYGLSQEEQFQFFGEVARVLRPGGTYLDGNYRNGGHRHPDNTQIGPKHSLESFIVSYIAPAEIHSLQPAPEEFAKLGLRCSTREWRGERPYEITDVRVLQKIG